MNLEVHGWWPLLALDKMNHSLLLISVALGRAAFNDLTLSHYSLVSE